MARPGPARRCAPGQSPTGPTLALSGSLAQSLFRSKNLGDEEVDCSCYLKLGIPIYFIFVFDNEQLGRVYMPNTTIYYAILLRSLWRDKIERYI